MFNGSKCDRKSQLSGVLTEPLNPRDVIRLVPLTECLCNKVNSTYRNMTLDQFQVDKFRFRKYVIR